MSSSNAPPTCPRCSFSFTKASSLKRHSKRCLQNIRTPSRKKSCSACANSKLRCDLQRPSCGRCRERALACEYVSRDGIGPSLVTATAPGPHTRKQRQGARSLSVGNKVTHASASSSPWQTASSIEFTDDDGQLESEISLSVANCGISSTPHSQANTSWENASDRDGILGSLTTTSGTGTEGLGKDVAYTPEIISPEFIISSYRRRALLGTANSPNSDNVARHTMYFVIRVLKSWPRMMAMHHTSHLPPIIHRLQLTDGIPIPLSNSYTLAKMWITHSEGSRDLVQQTILEEVRRLLRDYHSYGEMDLLAATQSMLILLIILFFGIGHSPALTHPIDAQLLIEMWDVKHSLASTGLFLEEESNHTLPSWKEWAIVSAKRRTILALHQLEFAWSLRHGYPVLTCLELGPLPAPAAKYLWQMTHEREWERLYKDWLKLWADGSYKMVELFRINAGKPSDDLDTRSELWLSDADEIGIMLMAEVNGIGIQY